MSDEPTGELHPFAEWLLKQSKGSTHQELTDGLAQLVNRVGETGKKGEMVLKITVEPTKGNDHLVVVSDQVSLKLPDFDRAASYFYTDEVGNLLVNDPNQVSFDFQREDV